MQGEECCSYTEEEHAALAEQWLLNNGITQANEYRARVLRCWDFSEWYTVELFMNQALQSVQLAPTSVVVVLGTIITNTSCLSLVL